jgi:hypothetical protein
MDTVMCYLGQGNEDETALMEPGMGNNKFVFLQDQVIIEKNIQIHGTGPLGNRPFPAEHFRLYPLQFSEEVVRSERGFKPENGIQECILGDRPDRFRIIEAGQGGNAATGNFSYFGDRPEKVQFTITKVRPEADICYGFHGVE